MSSSFVDLLQVESRKRRTVMSCVEYESVEMEESASQKEGETHQSKPFAVPSHRVRRDDQVALRVAEVLNLQLARGSMPT
jgi:hypothetical protein